MSSITPVPLSPAGCRYSLVLSPGGNQASPLVHMSLAIRGWFLSHYFGLCSCCFKRGWVTILLSFSASNSPKLTPMPLSYFLDKSLHKLNQVRGTVFTVNHGFLYYSTLNVRPQRNSLQCTLTLFLHCATLSKDPGKGHLTQISFELLPLYIHHPQQQGMAT